MKKITQWTIQNTRTFARDCTHIPRDIYKSIWGPIADRLEKYPDMPDGDKVKKIEGIKNWFTIKVRKDWRLAYKLYYKQNVVLLCYFEHKDVNKTRSRQSYRAPSENKIENVSGFDDQRFIDEIISDKSMHHELEKPPTKKKEHEVITRDIEKEKRNRKLNDEFLIQEYILKNKSIIREVFRITQELAENLISKAEEKWNDDKLLSLAGDRFGSRILGIFYPRTIKGVLNEERYEFPRLLPEQLEDEKLDEDIENMLSVMLVLDPCQEEFVGNFSDDHFKGPWLVKGPAGSGKTTVALRAINLIVKKNKNMGLDLPRILFTSHTNALSNTARVLLKKMGTKITTETSHTIAGLIRTAYWRKTKKEKIDTDIPSYFINFIRDKNRAYRLIRKAWEETSTNRFPLLGPNLASEEPLMGDEGVFPSHYEFMYEEFNLISGHGLTKIGYLDINSRKERVEKGARILDQQEKEDIWKIYERTRELSRENDLSLCGNEIFPWATEILEKLSPAERSDISYDYIFIDEAQDLPPVAIKFLASLLVNGSKGLFVAADSSQTIYSSFNSWNKILTTLNLKKDSIITLNRNHRCTKETWNAVNKILNDCESIDRSTVFTNEFPEIYQEPGRSGDRPKIIQIESKYLDSKKDEDKKIVMDAIMKELRKSQQKHHVAFSGISFLFRENSDGLLWEKKLPKYLNAKFNKSLTFDPNHKGLHLTSIKASKGLTYPVVVIPEFRQGKIPVPPKTNNQDISSINYSTNKNNSHTRGKPDNPVSGYNKKILSSQKGALIENKSNIKDDINEHYETELVNFFVACTRAQHQLILISCKDKPSEFIKHLDIEGDWDVVTIP